MQIDYWKKRWQENQTGWHTDRVHPLLQKYYTQFSLAPGAHVLIPLSGKTLDIEWLLQQGHAVTCIEISDIAIEAVRERMDIQWEITQHGPFTAYTYSKLTILQGDFFALPQITLPAVDFIFDRAAFVAIEPARRKTYAQIYTSLQPTSMLLILYRYDQHASTNPPFAFAKEEPNTLLEKNFEISILESDEVLDKFPGFNTRGIDAFYRDVYKIHLKS